MENKKEIEPKYYFDNLKSRVQSITDEDLQDFANGCLQLVSKYKITGQVRIIRKLRFLVDCVERESKLIKMGIRSFVYREDVEEYIDHVAKDVVKIIELENYPRDIPDEIVNIIRKTNKIFDQFYIVFTDYTGEVEKQVAKERREKDPILFGTFQEKTGNQDMGRQEIIINDRFYYLGDWVDEYCDLTMDKFLKAVGKEKLKIVGIPKNAEEIKEELHRLDDSLKIVHPRKKTFFTKIKSVLKK